MDTCRLVVFGQTAHANTGKTSTHEPTVVFQGFCVKMVWASWCDLIFASPARTGEPLHYRGNSLSPAQAAHVTGIEYDEYTRFFGQDLHHGVLGYVSSRRSTVTLFRTDQAIRMGRDPVWTYSPAKSKFEVSEICITAGGAPFLRLKTPSGATADQDDDYVVDTPNLEYLEALLETGQYPKESVRLLHYTTRLDVGTHQCCTNAVALTALDHRGSVHTYSPDSRYPACIGRGIVDGVASYGHRRAHPIDYLSETKVKRIASGGYYSAAISDEDELFLWGQACPTAKAKGHELSVFEARDEDDDDFIRPVSITCEGQKVVPLDVSIGWGHILIAGRVLGHPLKDDWFTVFGAGRNEHGQLGRNHTEFIKDFVEIREFRGKDIQQIICAGYTSYIVEKVM